MRAFRHAGLRLKNPESKPALCQDPPVISWRESASQQAQDDFDVLFNVSLDAATNFLVKRGEFLPFGVKIGSDDRVAIFAADPALGDRPPSIEVLKALADAARADRQRLQAVALVSDVTLVDGGDAVRAQLEHGEGAVIEIVVPYRRARVRRKVTTGEMSVSEGDRLIWVD